MIQITCKYYHDDQSQQFQLFAHFQISEKLKQNFTALMDALVKAKPAAAKGQYLKSVSVSSTMGPGAKINTTKALD